jgi:hypothetical protein
VRPFSASEAAFSPLVVEVADSFCASDCSLVPAAQAPPERIRAIMVAKMVLVCITYLLIRSKSTTGIIKQALLFARYMICNVYANKYGCINLFNLALYPCLMWIFK